MKLKSERKIIGSYPMGNDAGIGVYSINYEDETVNASMFVGDKETNIENCKMTEMDGKSGFYFKSIFVPFDEVMRV